MTFKRGSGEEETMCVSECEFQYLLASRRKLAFNFFLFCGLKRACSKAAGGKNSLICRSGPFFSTLKGEATNLCRLRESIAVFFRCVQYYYFSLTSLKVHRALLDLTLDTASISGKPAAFCPSQVLIRHHGQVLGDNKQ